MMTTSSTARFRVAVNAVIERDGLYLLARRRDIRWWHLVGGALEYDETIQQGLLREVREEIGASIDILRLVGVYAKPQKREVVLTFLCNLTADTTEPKTTEETAEIGWFATDHLPRPFLPKHRERLLDAAEDRCEAMVKAQTMSTEEDQGMSGESQVT